MINALNRLIELRNDKDNGVFLPGVWHNNKYCEPSNSDLRRWLDSKSIVINGTRPKAFDKIDYSIIQLVFFPKGRGRVSLVGPLWDGKD